MENSGMQNFELRSHVGPDGMLHLHIPVGVTDSEVDVTVTVKPVPPGNEPHSPEELEAQYAIEEELL